MGTLGIIIWVDLSSAHIFLGGYPGITWVFSSNYAKYALCDSCIVFSAREINCSTECKWDNGIGYAVYPGDCSMFVQCDSLYGHPLIQQCPWGLLWSLDVLQCTFPHMSECGKLNFSASPNKRAISYMFVHVLHILDRNPDSNQLPI